MSLALALGFAGAPWWVLIALATLLSLTSLDEFGRLQPRLMRAGAPRVFGGTVLATAALSIAMALACYGTGRAAGWLVAGNAPQF